MRTEPDAGNDRALHTTVLVVLAFVVVGGAVDLYLDAPERWWSVHVLVEATLTIVSATVGVLLWRAWRTTSHTLKMAQQSLVVSQAAREEWRRRADHALQGLGRAINDQFDDWELSPAERDVALLLLKGHGHKQIAAATKRSESTVRQHAVAVYGKSGQRGRAELAAFFLEAIMLPSESSDTSRPL